MRADSFGLFWHDTPKASTRAASGPRQLAPIPDTGWQRPAYFPDLSRAHTIAVDCETWDPELVDWKDENGDERKGRGPGWARGKGHIVGVSIGADGGGRWYFPIRHTVEPEWNFDPEVVMCWLREQLGRPHQAKVGANLQYDVGWLKQEGVEVRGPLYDVQYAESLLWERAKVSLEVLGQKYLHEGKQTDVLYEWLSRSYGGKADSNQRKNIWRAPPRLVGPYAESDADLPLRLLPVLWQHLQREGMLDLFQRECRLIPLIVAMRFAGVRIDVPKTEALRDRLFLDQAAEQKKLDEIAGTAVDVNSAEHLARAFDALGIAYTRTAKSNAPSFTVSFLENLEHPVGAAIRRVRQLEKLRKVFVESYLLGSHVNGMVYCQFHQLRSDSNGARSGRFSSSDPNLQNIPSRDEVLAPLLRECFVPDLGHKQWRRYDYSQIEYRFLIHFAVGPGSDDIRAYFNANPDTDYHELVLDMVAPYAGWDISTKEKRKHRRKPLKNINFGLIYGMGQAKLARSLGLTAKESKQLFEVYHVAVPFAKATMDACSEEAQRTGEIRTILNRRSQFDLWEPDTHVDSGKPALPYELALSQYAFIRRALTHKALNRRLQGSAADLMKEAMLQCWESGVFDYTGVPRLTVHDELDFSDPGGKDDGFAYIKHTMEHALRLRIPVRADMELGPDWGHCEAVA